MVGAVVHVRRVRQQRRPQVDGLPAHGVQQRIEAPLRVEQRRVGRQVVPQHIGGGGHHHHAAILVRIGVEKVLHLRQIFLVLGGIKGVGRHLGEVPAIPTQPRVVDLQPQRRALHQRRRLHPPVTQRDLVGHVVLRLLGEGAVHQRCPRQRRLQLQVPVLVGGELPLRRQQRCQRQPHQYAEDGQQRGQLPALMLTFHQACAALLGIVHGKMTSFLIRSSEAEIQKRVIAVTHQKRDG